MTLNSMVKGVAVGMAVGTATYMITNASSRTKKKVQRNAGRAIKAFGSVIDGVQTMMR